MFGLLAACRAPEEQREEMFYNKPYATLQESRNWARDAPLKDVCQATKQWHHSHIREAARDEIEKRGLNTKICYYNGLSLTP